MSDHGTRWAWVDVDLDAIRHNVAYLRSVVAPSELWAVVKANGYGHGAVEVATAALEAGAQGLCVALVSEGVELRTSGIDAPILVLSEQPADAVDDIVRYRLMATVYTPSFIDALAAAARSRRVDGVPVHLKIDTGMQRVGVPVDGVVEVASAIAAHRPTLMLVGVFTHLALADEPTEHFTDTQLARFQSGLAELSAAVEAQGPGGSQLLVHAANSAGALAHPSARSSFVRAGIAIYGISPGHGIDSLCSQLRPALALTARISHVKPVSAGTSISYGQRHTFDRDTIVATVPIGYADGVPRRLFDVGAHVLIGGTRCPIVGVVTMDQLMVDCGHLADADAVAVGDEVVLIGEQDGPDGMQRVRAEDWADLLGTIGYEIVCGISGRVPRRHGRSIQSEMSGDVHA